MRITVQKPPVIALEHKIIDSIFTSENISPLITLAVCVFIERHTGLPINNEIIADYLHLGMDDIMRALRFLESINYLTLMN